MNNFKYNILELEFKKMLIPGPRIDLSDPKSTKTCILSYTIYLLYTLQTDVAVIKCNFNFSIVHMCNK